MKRVGICGHYGGNTNSLDGQTVKTKTLTRSITEKLGADEVETVDTYGGISRVFSILFQLWRTNIHCKNIIILPAHNALQVLAPFLKIVNHFYHRKLHYVVIGGWLPEFLKKRNWLAKYLKKFDYIYVETSTMKTNLEKQGFKNVVMLPNCKELRILSLEELVYSESEPYRLCTFSRVSKEKGIEDAVNAVIQTNNKHNKTIYQLDIYGQIDSNYVERFDQIKQSFPPYIRYNGCVPFDRSTDVLKDYYLLLFPTYYAGEGFAGTLLDAFAAGVPILASNWKYNAEIVENNVTGFIFQNQNLQDLVEKLEKAYTEVERINQMRKKCLEKAEECTPKKIICIITDRFVENVEKSSHFKSDVVISQLLNNL